MGEPARLRAHLKCRDTQVERMRAGLLVSMARVCALKKERAGNGMSPPSQSLSLIGGMPSTTLSLCGRARTGQFFGKKWRDGLGSRANPVSPVEH